MQAEEIQLTLPTITLSAKVWGDSSGLPILALHGWMDNAASFDFLAPRLSGVQLVALELPGHGLSQHRPQGYGYHFIDYIPDVLAAANALGWEKLNLLGHSLGAAVASFVAVAAPERVERLLLIEGTGPLSEVAGNGPERLRRALQQARQLEAKPPKQLDSIDEAIRLRLRNGELSHAAVESLVRRAIEAVEGGVRWRHDRRLSLASPYYPVEAQVLAMLRAIECPVLLVQATDGLLTMRPTTEERCAAFPHLSRHILAGHHHLHMDNAEEVAGVIQKFLFTPQGQEIGAV